MKLPENVSESVRRRNPHLYGKQNRDGSPRLCAAKPECVKGEALVGAVSGQASGGTLPLRRARITFTVYARRPLDWDNYRLKDLQDCLIEAGFLHSDAWQYLEGSVVSKKAHSKKEEATIIEIEAL